MKAYMEQKTGIATRLGDHSGWLSEDTPVKYADPEYAQLIGTVLLTCDYRTENQRRDVGKVKTGRKVRSRKSLSETLGQMIFDFFGDDTSLVNDNPTSPSSSDEQVNNHSL